MFTTNDAEEGDMRLCQEEGDVSNGKKWAMERRCLTMRKIRKKGSVNKRMKMIGHRMKRRFHLKIGMASPPTESRRVSEGVGPQEERYLMRIDGR